MSRLVLLAIVIIIAICTTINCNYDVKKLDETPTRGSINISVDESYSQIIDAELDVFHNLYKYAKVTPKYTNEDSIFKDLLTRRARVIVANRRLDSITENSLKIDSAIYIKTVRFAYDAIAFITNNSNPDSLMQYPTVKDIFEGKVSDWKQINPKSKLGKLTLVFDNNKSCNTRYFREKFKIQNKFPDYCRAVNSNEEVINYVEKNPNAIGILSVNWISDREDSLSITFLKRFKVVSFTSEMDPTGNDYYGPYQAYIQTKSYPFIRDVYLISRESFQGLGTGFSAFVAGEKGQRIVKLSGLLPATMPIRIIQIKN